MVVGRSSEPDDKLQKNRRAVLSKAQSEILAGGIVVSERRVQSKRSTRIGQQTEFGHQHNAETVQNRLERDSRSVAKRHVGRSRETKRNSTSVAHGRRGI